MTERETLTQFFNTELESLELKTGSNQFARIMALRDAAQELARLVAMLVEICTQAPFDKMPVEAKIRIIQDQMMRDEHFVAPPFGQLSGFNQRIVYKWLNNHYQQHEHKIEQNAIDRVLDYTGYLKLCEHHGMSPMPEEEFGKPMTDERRKHWAEQFYKQIASIQDPEKVPHNTFRQRYGQSVLPGYLATKQKFIVEGIEIYADSEEQAQQMYAQTQQQ